MRNKVNILKRRKKPFNKYRQFSKFHKKPQLIQAIILLKKNKHKFWLKPRFRVKKDIKENIQKKKAIVENKFRHLYPNIRANISHNEYLYPNFVSFNKIYFT